MDPRRPNQAAERASRSSGGSGVGMRPAVARAFTLVELLIVVVIFGTRKLTSMGGDLGGAIKGFRKAMGDAESDANTDHGAEAKKLDEPDAEFSEQHTEKHQTDRNHTS